MEREAREMAPRGEKLNREYAIVNKLFNLKVELKSMSPNDFGRLCGGKEQSDEVVFRVCKDIF